MWLASISFQHVSIVSFNSVIFLILILLILCLSIAQTFSIGFISGLFEGQSIYSILFSFFQLVTNLDLCLGSLSSCNIYFL